MKEDKYWWGIWPYGYMANTEPQCEYGKWDNSNSSVEQENGEFTYGECSLLGLLYTEFIHNICLLSMRGSLKDTQRKTWETTLIEIVRDTSWM